MTSAQRYVPGEALARFAPGSAGAAAVETALRANPPDLAALTPAVSALETDVRLPLAASALSGGKWVVLKIDAERLIKDAVDRLRAQKWIRSAEAIPSDAGRHAPGILVEFLPALREPEDISTSITLLAAELELPLVGGMRADGRARIDVDWDQLTMILVERLNASRAIEAAQPNYILGLRPAT
jgi:hypothetical protein